MANFLLKSIKRLPTTTKIIIKMQSYSNPLKTYFEKLNYGLPNLTLKTESIFKENHETTSCCFNQKRKTLAYGRRYMTMNNLPNPNDICLTYIYYNKNQSIQKMDLKLHPTSTKNDFISFYSKFFLETLKTFKRFLAKTFFLKQKIIYKNFGLKPYWHRFNNHGQIQFSMGGYRQKCIDKI